jgi:hypothetical protein
MRTYGQTHSWHCKDNYLVCIIAGNEAEAGGVTGHLKETDHVTDVIDLVIGTAERSQGIGKGHEGVRNHARRTSRAVKISLVKRRSHETKISLVKRRSHETEISPVKRRSHETKISRAIKISRAKSRSHVIKMRQETTASHVMKIWQRRIISRLTKISRVRTRRRGSNTRTKSSVLELSTYAM